MGSKVWTSSTAVDNRLAVTDQGFGLSSSGSGNNTALAGHILNINGGGGSAGKGSAGSAAGSIAVNILDGGAVDKALDFAGFSLSAMLDSIVTGQKTQAAAAAYQADTIGQAVTQSAAQQAAATAAQTEVEAQKMTTIKKLALGAAVVGVAWYLWKGRK